VPEICRFFGIVICMFPEAGAPHHRPHFHAFAAGRRAVFAVSPVQLLAGELTLRQQRLVLAWAELHEAELLENWERLRAHLLPVRIEPLR
jgi:Domain of unknown function (DUF4160)